MKCALPEYFPRIQKRHIGRKAALGRRFWPGWPAPILAWLASTDPSSPPRRF
jgi:hypothetical protein